MTTIDEILKAWMEVERVLELLPVDDPDREAVRRAADALDDAYRDAMRADRSDEVLALSQDTIARSRALLSRIRADRVTSLARETLELLADRPLPVKGARVQVER